MFALQDMVVELAVLAVVLVVILLSAFVLAADLPRVVSSGGGRRSPEHAGARGLARLRGCVCSR